MRHRHLAGRLRRVAHFAAAGGVVMLAGVAVLTGAAGAGAAGVDAAGTGVSGTGTARTGAALGPAASVAAQRTRAADVTIQVLDVSPNTPALTYSPAPLHVSLQLHNTTGRTLRKVTVLGARGDPISTQKALDASLADRTPPAEGLPIPATHPVQVDLAPDETTQVTFDTYTQIPDDGRGICLCLDAIYPLYFSAHRDGTTGPDGLLGTGATWLPSFGLHRPTPMRIGWVWPLVDRPHRLTSETVFLDDDLAGTVAPGGRLSRALGVAERAGPQVPMTLVVDPDLLDELEVMSSGRYTVQTRAGPVAGTGRSAATLWLQRFGNLVAQNQDIQVAFTPYGDPDVESLSQSGLSWSAGLPAAIRQRVTLALDGRTARTDISWPAAGALGKDTLSTLADQGVRTVLLGATRVTPYDGAGGTVPTGVARLASGSHTVGAALASSTAEGYVSSVVTRGRAGKADLPKLVSELAIRAAVAPNAPHTVILTPPRYVDPDPRIAARAILDTSRNAFAQPVSLPAATAPAALPTVRSRVPATVRVRGLPAPVTDADIEVSRSLPAVRSLLIGTGTTPAAKAVVAALPVGLQRAGSAYWAYDGRAGARYATSLTAITRPLLGGVKIVKPTSGQYTLASSNSPLPVTVHNGLAYAARIRIQVTTFNNLPGFSTPHDIGTKLIQPNSTTTYKLPTAITRSGRIEIEAQLLTADGESLGGPVQLVVRSTVLGVVGIVITVVAGGVLVLALLVRAVRRLRGRRPGSTPGQGRSRPRLPESEPAT